MPGLRYALLIFAHCTLFTLPALAVAPEKAKAVPTSFTAEQAKFQQAKSEKEKEQIRAEIKQLFYSSTSDEEKDQIREFFKKNPSEVEHSSDSSAARSPASAR